MALGLLVAAGDAAAQGVVATTPPPPVAPGIAAIPRIPAPADEAERRINAAVARLDGTVRKAAVACRTQSRGPAAADAEWTRHVAVTMAGPGYLSYAITDDVFCGGAHPSTGTMAIVYDLRTGRPVDWRRLLPAALTGTIALQPGMDGTRMATLDSPRLQRLYVRGYGGTGQAGNRYCVEAVTAPNGRTSAPSMVWLDAAADGLAVQFDLAHVLQACALPVVIPAATLRAEGADAGLLAALAAAHAASGRRAK